MQLAAAVLCFIVDKDYMEWAHGSAPFPVLASIHGNVSNFTLLSAHFEETRRMSE